MMGLKRFICESRFITGFPFTCFHSFSTASFIYSSIEADVERVEGEKTGGRVDTKVFKAAL